MSWTSTILGNTLINAVGDSYATDDIISASKYVALYFSAHYCVPCQKFTPMFSILYEDRPTSDIEVIFVSNDRTKEEFDKYFEDMPWFAIPYESKDLLNKIKLHYNITGIPHVIILNSKTGEIVNKDARNTIASKMMLSVETLT